LFAKFKLDFLTDAVYGNKKTKRKRSVQKTRKNELQNERNYVTVMVAKEWSNPLSFSQ